MNYLYIDHYSVAHKTLLLSPFKSNMMCEFLSSKKNLASPWTYMVLLYSETSYSPSFKTTSTIPREGAPFQLILKVKGQLSPPTPYLKYPKRPVGE